MYYVNRMYAYDLNVFSAAEMRRRRGGVVRPLGGDSVLHIYHYADVLHYEAIDRVADEYISMSGIPMGDYDNVPACRYEVPGYWTYRRGVLAAHRGRTVG